MEKMESWEGTSSNKYMTTAGGDVAKQEGGTLKNGSPNRQSP